MYGLSAGSKEVAVVNEMRWPLVEVQLYLPPPPFWFSEGSTLHPPERMAHAGTGKQQTKPAEQAFLNFFFLFDTRSRFTIKSIFIFMNSFHNINICIYHIFLHYIIIFYKVLNQFTTATRLNFLAKPLRSTTRLNLN